ncbi:MAG: pyridoxal phosphate-dependent aminotransferase [Oscillospiraceae bacterium]|nr:pyridoxal phosphate-dependent aminotransferase [Oscillospiraceae bacterium]
MKPLSTLALAVHPSATMAIDTMYKSMKAQGIDVVGFGAGEPDFPTPDNIKEACIKALAENKTKYTAASGIVELKKAVCYRMKEDCGIDYDPSEVLIASGAKHNVYLAVRALVNPGDEVVIPAPFWVSYSEIVGICGGVPVVVQTREEEGFKLTPEALDAAITDNTKCVLLNSPSNPTGMMYTGQELRALADVCIKRDVYIIADEIYYKLVYDGNEFVSIASLGEDVKERSIIINGVSKSYAMTGWRIGYSLAPAHITKVMSSYVSHSTAAPSTLSQWAAVEALTGPQEQVEEMRKAFEARRNYMVERVNSIPGVSCLMPEGAFYVMMNVSKIFGKKSGDVVIDSCDKFASELLEKGLVAVVPGSGFDAPNYVRWSYATSMENIKEGMDRLEKFLAGLTD